jgi:DNA repair exonuclease SbcCD ATPase subunit
VKFTDIIIENVLTIGQAQFRLDGQGLVLVEGINDDESSADSNGAGKSSVVEAINWCLWGSTARGITGDDIINTTAGKNAKVSTTIDDDGDLYRVDRYRKAAKFKNGLFLFRWDAAKNEWLDLTKGTTAQTQKQIERLLGCSEEVFKAAVYSGQEEMPDIPRMTDKQLKLLVEQAAGVDVLAGAYDIARERLRERAGARSDAQVAFDRATERVDTAQRSLVRLRDDMTAWGSSQQIKIANLKQRTTEAVKAYNDAKGELDPAGEQELQTAIADCQTKIASVNTERQREAVLQNDLQVAQGALNAAQRNVAVAENTTSARARGVTAAREVLERIKNGTGQPCDDCGRPLEAEHLAAATAAAQTNLDVAVSSHAEAEDAEVKAKARAAGAEKMVTAAQEALEKHRAGMTDVTGEATRLKSLQRELQIIAATKQEVERLRVQAQNLAQQWQAEQKATNPFTAPIERADKELVDLQQKAEEAKALVLEKIDEEKYAEAVVQVFAPAGVRAHRLDEATPYLNERTAHYLGSLADGAIEAFWTTLTETKGKGELREKFSVTVESANAPSFNNLSGGEKRKVRLACALALQDLVATRASKSIDLWIGDEIDDALDPAGLERLMGVLEEKARDRGTVLVISHNDIKDFARKTFTVRKTGGRATVTIQ